MRCIFGARAALAAGVAAAGVACAAHPASVEYASEGAFLETSDGLHRVERWGFSDAFLKPGADLARYDRVIVGDVSIAYKRPRHAAHVSRDGIARDTYLLSARAEASFKRHLQAALADEFDRSGDFYVTEQVAPDAIRLTPHILDLVIYTPLDRGWGQATTTFVKTRGEFTLILDVRDAQSGVALLRVAKHSSISLDGAGAYLPANPVTTAAAARQIFRETAVRLRRQMEILRALPEIPPTPNLASRGD